MTFGVAFFPMYYRLVEGRNRHFQNEAEFEQHVGTYLKSKGLEPPSTNRSVKARNSKLWAVSIILIIPAFIIVYLLSKDLILHEQEQDAFLVAALPKRVFMTQSIPIKTYLLITLVTLGVGVVYWLYKLVNFYNAHYKAHLQVEKEMVSILEEEKNVKLV